MAAFLGQKDMQEQARGGIIWVDEAGLLPIDDLDRVCGLAKELDAASCCKAIPANINPSSGMATCSTVLEDYAGLPVAKLTKIQRQKGDYAQAVAAIRDGDVSKGDATLGSSPIGVKTYGSVFSAMLTPQIALMFSGAHRRGWAWDFAGSLGAFQSPDVARGRSRPDGQEKARGGREF